LVLLLLWGTRLAALESLPLHNDEGLHLTRAVEVWNGHPFWQIYDGKIVNHWLIAAFYPQNQPVFVARVATLFVTFLGCAAGMALARRWLGSHAAVFAGALWVSSSYLFFYERLALSDVQAGALVVVALWAALHAARNGRWQDAVLTGLALGAAFLFKISAIPFAAVIGLALLFTGRLSLSKRIQFLLLIGVIVALLFVPPLAYLFLRGEDAFWRALEWVRPGAGGDGSAGNMARLWAQLSAPGMISSSVMMVVGLLLLPLLRPRVGIVLWLGLAIPVLALILLGNETLPRHYAVALPLAVVLGGAGAGRALERIRFAPLRWLVLGMLAVEFGAFALHAYRDPAGLPLPPAMRTQYVTEHSGGYGLREAVLDFPNTIGQANAPIIGSMFSGGCRRANFYASAGYTMQCVDAPGIPDIEAALAKYGMVYVLTDSAPSIGADVTALDARATRLAAYPRPGESMETASVVLWRLERGN